jgi:hypothetical protein
MRKLIELLVKRTEIKTFLLFDRVLYPIETFYLKLTDMLKLIIIFFIIFSFKHFSLHFSIFIYVLSIYKSEPSPEEELRTLIAN